MMVFLVQFLPAVRPVIAAVQSNVLGVEQNSADLEIRLENAGFPAVSPADITWSRQGGPRIVNGSNIYIVDNGLRLHINNVTAADEGVYTVTVSNAAGSVSTNISLDHQGT